MNMLSVAATQMACSWDLPANLDNAEKLIRQAAGAGARVILIQELFETPYFCIEQDAKHFSLATTLDENQSLKRFQALAEELDVVLPFSWFERANRAFYNSLAMVNAGGEVLGVYRKSHIPNGPGYQEKQYFNPGDTGFRVWDTRYGRIGCGVCWDQWFPEAARAMALQGADLLLYPTAIGAEPQDETLDTAARWRRAMQGHAVSNVIPVVAANRVGDEDGQLFYGTSFICDHVGEVVADLDRTEQGTITATFDLDEIERERAAWGFFRDRRPDLYDQLV